MTACPQCTNEAQLLLQAHDYNRHISDAIFSYYRCSSCDLIFLSPTPANLGDYYPQSYYNLPSSMSEFAHLAEPQKYKIDIVRQFVNTGQLLEIGPGPGEFAFLAKHGGFDVDVIEMDARCCQFLRDVIGVNVVHSAETTEALRSLGTYNVITLWHVFEHLPDPWGTLEAMIEHLAPGGVLILAAPNPDAFQFSIFGRRWTHLDAPRHLQLAPIKLLTNLLVARGLMPVMITTTDPGSLSWNAFGWHMSLRNLFSNRIAQLSMRILARVVREIVRPIERSGLHGSTYTLVFQK